MLAATNIRLVQNVGDGTYVTMTWDDPNPTGTTTKVRFYDQTNPSTELVYITRDLTTKTYVCKGGQAIRISLANAAGSTASSDYVTAPSAIAYVPPESPPVLTAQEHLETVFGPLPEGTVIGRIVADPEYTVQADGSVIATP